MDSNLGSVMGYLLIWVSHFISPGLKFLQGLVVRITWSITLHPLNDSKDDAFMKRLCRKLREGLKEDKGGGCLVRHPQVSKTRELSPTQSGRSRGRRNRKSRSYGG